MEEIENILREWTPMTDLLNKIPMKAQSGLFLKEILFTAVDILPEFIAIGTNIGLVYWYNRKTGDIQRLRCENSNFEITCVKIISTVEYMVACGTCQGQINIFQIPKSHPDTIPDTLKPKHNQQVERYTVADLHNTSVTSLEWSKNGMKLFSGDKTGIVVLTEIDFYMHICKSVEILNESYEIVQLSYIQHYLLISTAYRSIIAWKEENKWRVCQVGKKDRKVIGKFGGVLWKTGLKPTDLVAYCSRPGLRLWVSNLSGSVQQTLLFKDLVTKECTEVPLLNPIGTTAKKLKPQRELSFGQLQQFCDKFLVTHDSESVFILDPINLLVVAMINHVRRVLAVAVYKDEIFILEGERSLIRVAFQPEHHTADGMSSNIPTASTFLPFTNSIKDIRNKLQTTSIISALPTFLEETSVITECALETENASVTNAEEATEASSKQTDTSPDDNNLNNSDFYQNSTLNIDRSEYISKFESPKHGSIKARSQNSPESLRKLELYQKIGEQSFDDDILFKHCRKKKQRNVDEVNPEMSTSALSCGSDNEIDKMITKSTLLNLSTLEINDDIIQPDLRSPDAIQNDIKIKEKLLENILNFDKINPPVDELTNGSVKQSGLNESKKLMAVNETFKNTLLERAEKISKISVWKHPESLQNKREVKEKSVQEPIIQKKQDDEPLVSFITEEDIVEAPVFSVPNTWNVENLMLNDEQSDNSLTDWEIID